MASRIDHIAREVAGPTRGLARTRALCEAGLHRSTIARRIAAGVWERPHHGVVDTTCERWDWRRRVIAAVLANAEGTVASHRTAAALHGLPGFPASGGIEITTPRAARTSSLPYVVHSSVRIDLGATVIDQVPCAGPARTLVGLGVCVSDRVLARAVRDALRRGLVDPCALHSPALDHLPGATRARAAASRQLEASTHAQDSPLEGEVIDRLLEEAAVPTFVTQHTVEVDQRRMRLDIAWPDLRIAVEVDGARWHADDLATIADEQRQRLLEQAGWVVLRVTAADLASASAWARFTARLRAALSC